MTLERNLVRSRWLLNRLGVNSFTELKTGIETAPEGPRGDGHSHFLGHLDRAGLRIDWNRLEAYDLRVMELERELTRARHDVIGFKYFQYLALLFTELWLDELTADPAALLSSLNSWLTQLRHDEPALAGVPDFDAAELRRLAFFMATGSGKTLLMHAHIRQVQHYLRVGTHRSALLGGQASEAAFDNILLITPGPGLSAQHLNEFIESHIPAVHLSEALDDPQRYADHIRIVEIHKLVERATGDGVSIPLGELGGRNLVLVDEGHKGTGSEAQTWKNRQRAVSAEGMLLEYSATFAQAIAAAGRREQESLVAEYGKAILFDYSYRWFYGDGFGKDFRVLNISKAAQDRANDLLLAGLLVFYRQWRTYLDHADEAPTYNLAPPLWVFVGSSVNASAVYSAGGERKSDVATVIAFLKRFLADRDWATRILDRLLSGKSVFTDNAGNDLLAERLKAWKRRKATGLYDEICKQLFGGQGTLEAWAIKGADGELGLKVAGSNVWFGLVNIGDVATLKKYLHEHNVIEVQDDQLTGGLFKDIERVDSPIKLLIGARKFTEGWSSWRVSSMGLLNMGRGEGSLVIQLFGRGVRLKGREMSLKRSSHLPGEHPDWLEDLERLEIFGWNGDYIARFRAILENEGFARTIEAPAIPMKSLPKGLYVPHPKAGYTTTQETWLLTTDGPEVYIDRRPKVSTATGRDIAQAISTAAASGQEYRLDQEEIASKLDHEALYLALIDHKQRRSHDNLFIDKAVIPSLLENCTLRIDYPLTDSKRLQRDAEMALCTYVDRFLARAERKAENAMLAPAKLSTQEAPGSYLLQPTYEIRIHDQGIERQIQEIVSNRNNFETSGGSPLPRLHIDQHLYQPLVSETGINDNISVSPAPLKPSETALLMTLTNWWSAHHKHYPDIRLYILRNLPRIGIGLYQRSGFYPDFIVWVTCQRTKQQRILLLEPHGLHHETPNALESDKVKALAAFRDLGKTKAFSKKNIVLDGYIISETPIDQIPGGVDGKPREKLAEDHAVILSKPNDDWWIQSVLGL
ncbi:MAG: hypothetical protein CMN57_07260 [Gammaproteobacteria bacterium]|nr:hypothetical protein [Gammaproteobacteria bacterium]